MSETHKVFLAEVISFSEEKKNMHLVIDYCANRAKTAKTDDERDFFIDHMSDFTKSVMNHFERTKNTQWLAAK